METPALVRDLRRPDAYPERPRQVGFLQTHVSLLFFAGERVYKVKKPVDLGFLDFTTPDRRRHFCEEEVSLNRRLAPNVYLGVIPIAQGRDGRASVGGEGEAVDWAVEMVRLPETRMLSTLLEEGEIDNALLGELVALLVRFHATAATGPGVDEFGTPAAIAANVEENFAQLGPLAAVPPAHLEFLASRARGFLAASRDLLERRVRDGRIREGHGDLHAGNVCCTTEGIVAYDCIEFSRRLRCGDVACDLAFLAMDLDERGYPGFSAYLARRYADEAGDAELPDLLAFYKAYRAVVRGKVAAMAALDDGLGAGEREARRLESMRYLQLAASYDLPPALVLLCGLPATGKTWLARRVGRALRAAVLRSDARRRVLGGDAGGQEGASGYGTGRYSAERKEATYRAMLDDAITALAAGHPVVVDATFSRRRFREPFLSAARRLGRPCFVVHVTADEATVRERLARRARDARELSEADLEVYLRERDGFEPPGEVSEAERIEFRSGARSAEEAGEIVIERMIASHGAGPEAYGLRPMGRGPRPD